jgi:type 1 glutamine amidotransferase
MGANGIVPGMHFLPVLLALAAPDTAAMAAPAAAPRVLVVTVTKGFRHDSIPDLEKLVGDLASESGAFAVDYARTDADLSKKMTKKALAGYDAVVFASTTGDLPLPDRDAFVDWIVAGHGFVGLHAATDTFPGFPRYLDLVGGQFQRHGPQVKVEVKVTDAAHPSTQGLGPSFEVFDEIYEFQRFDPLKVHRLLDLDKHPQTQAAGSYPLAWTREVGKGRVFYTALGHRADVIAAPWYRRHVLGGVRWALRR